MRAKDSRKRSLLSFAATLANKDMFEAVREYLKRELTENEVYQRLCGG